MAETQKPKAAPKKKASAKTEIIEESAMTETVIAAPTEEKSFEEIEEMVETVMENAEAKAEEVAAEGQTQTTEELDATIVATSELIQEVHESTKELETKLASATPEEAKGLIDEQIKHIDETIEVKRKMINPNVTYYWNGCKTY